MSDFDDIINGDKEWEEIFEENFEKKLEDFAERIAEEVVSNGIDEEKWNEILEEAKRILGEDVDECDTGC